MPKTSLLLRPLSALALIAALASADAPLAGAQEAAQPAAESRREDKLREQLERNLASIKLAPGFTISLYALVPNARAMAVAPDGKTVFVGTRDTNLFALPLGPGFAPVSEALEFAPAIAKKMPHGLCFAKDGTTLYVAEQNRILAYPDAAAGLHEPAPPFKTIVAQGALIPPEFEASNHSTRVCRFGPDGKLYVSLGQPFNVPPKDKAKIFSPLGIGAIVRFDADGKKREVYARGLRNSVGLDFNPADGTLWFTDNQVDRMGDDIPPGELNRATKAGQHFGFPWYGGGHVRTNEYKDETPPKGVVFPQVEMDAHAADLGMTFYRGKAFPAPWRGGIFSAQHGSWNRTVPIGARVMFTSLKRDGTADKTQVFAEGWLQADGSYWGRPNDVAELPDGSLLVSDDYNGALYRIAYKAP